MSAAARRFDPANDTHYAISEDAELRLRQIAEAADFLGQVVACVDPEKFDPQEDGFSAMFHTLGFAIEGALRDRAVVFPGKRA